MNYNVIRPGAMMSIGAFEGTPQESYGFVMNVGTLVGATSFTLAPGHELRRASAEEAKRIKEIIQSHGTTPLETMRWECRLPLVGQLEPLPETEWRYFVISFRGVNTTLNELEEVFSLTRLELRIGFTILHDAMIGGGGHGGLIMHPGRFFQQMDSALNAVSFLDVTMADVDQVALIHSQLKQHDHRLVNVERLVRQLLDLEALPHHSPLLFLGYFALLESLLVHKPDPDDPYTSITRQVIKKLALLNHRCKPSFDYTAFGGAKPEKIWTTMYAYRSSLAHGDEPDFAGPLKLLVNRDTALELVKQTVRAAIRQALIEPQLIVDLRDC